MTLSSTTSRITLALQQAQQLLPEAKLILKFQDRKDEFRSQIDWIVSTPPNYKHFSRQAVASELQQQFPDPHSTQEFWVTLLELLEKPALTAATSWPDQQVDAEAGDPATHRATQAAPLSGTRSPEYRTPESQVPQVQALAAPAGAHLPVAAASDRITPASIATLIRTATPARVTTVPISQPTVQVDKATVDEAIVDKAVVDKATVAPPTTDDGWREDFLALSHRMRAVKAQLKLDWRDIAELTGRHGAFITANTLRCLSNRSFVESSKYRPQSVQKFLKLTAAISIIEAELRTIPAEPSKAPTKVLAVAPVVLPARSNAPEPTGQTEWTDAYMALCYRLLAYKAQHALTWPMLLERLQDIGASSTVKTHLTLSLMGSPGALLSASTNASRPYGQDRYEEISAGLELLEEENRRGAAPASLSSQESPELSPEEPAEKDAAEPKRLRVTALPTTRRERIRWIAEQMDKHGQLNSSYVARSLEINVKIVNGLMDEIPNITFHGKNIWKRKGS